LNHNVVGYNANVIVSFRDAETATVWNGRCSRQLPGDIQAVALRKLRLLNNAKRLDDLRAPPGTLDCFGPAGLAMTAQSRHCEDRERSEARRSNPARSA
jgi:hypothetical protein